VVSILLWLVVEAPERRSGSTIM